MALLTVALLNIFVLVAGLTARDVITARPPEPVGYPLADAGAAPEPPEPPTAPFDTDRLAALLEERMGEAGGADGLSAYVGDAATGEPLFTRQADVAAVPASTTKIVTTIAALHALGPDERLSTRVVQGAGPEEIILVGGGDPTLTETRDPDRYPRVATLEELAADTADTLLTAGIDTVRLGYDTSLYTGPDMGPGWKQGYIDEGSAATVHALMHDGGRLDRDEKYGQRHPDPPQATAEAFADQLAEAGITVSGAPAEQPADEGAEELARVLSAPISGLVEIVMVESENNVAEALARQVALAEGEEPSFGGASDAIHGVMAELGVSDVHVEDGSGLSVNNEITAQALAELLLLATDEEHPELRYTLTGLPVAHFTGTLSDRYSAYSDASAGAGLVRGKTGTLNGVSTLAGLIHAADGRVLVFALMLNDPAAMGTTLDRFAATVAECGC